MCFPNYYFSDVPKLWYVFIFIQFSSKHLLIYLLKFSLKFSLIHGLLEMYYLHLKYLGIFDKYFCHWVLMKFYRGQRAHFKFVEKILMTQNMIICVQKSLFWCVECSTNANSCQVGWKPAQITVLTDFLFSHFIHYCYGLNFVPHKFICWSSNPLCDGGWRLGIWSKLGLDDIMRMGLFVSLSLSLPWEDTARRWPSANRKRALIRI